MAARKNQPGIPPQEPNFASHRAHCTVCAHPQCKEIERDFISWRSSAKIATEYRLGNRSAVYRHAHALDLFSKRTRNIRASLERIIEKVDDVRVTGGNIVQAVELHARINGQGKFVEKDELVSYHDLFEKMTRDELEAYAKYGTLPAWFPPSNGTKDSE